MGDEERQQDVGSAEESPEEVPAGEGAAEEEAPVEEPTEEAEAKEAPAEEPEEAPAEEAPAEEAAAPATEAAAPEEELTPKQRRRLERSLAAGPPKPQRSAEERAAERAGRRREAAESRRRYRQGRRARRGERGQGTPPAEREGAAVRKVRQGTVASSRADKTIAVRIEIVRRHPRYEKVVRRSRIIHAHDERNEASEGDVVRVVESRPLSRTKRWRLVEVVERAPVRIAAPEPAEEAAAVEAAGGES